MERKEFRKLLVKQTERAANIHVFKEEILKNSRYQVSLSAQASDLENERSLIEAIKKIMRMKIIRKPDL